MIWLTHHLNNQNHSKFEKEMLLGKDLIQFLSSFSLAPCFIYGKSIWQYRTFLYKDQITQLSENNKKRQN